MLLAAVLLATPRPAQAAASTRIVTRANAREIIAVSFDPFDTAHPAFALKMPLFVLIFALVGTGVLVGGIAAWLKQHRWRMRARPKWWRTRR